MSQSLEWARLMSIVGTVLENTRAWLLAIPGPIGSFMGGSLGSGVVLWFLKRIDTKYDRKRTAQLCAEKLALALEEFAKACSKLIDLNKELGISANNRAAPQFVTHLPELKLPDDHEGWKELDIEVRHLAQALSVETQDRQHFLDLALFDLAAWGYDDDLEIREVSAGLGLRAVEVIRALKVYYKVPTTIQVWDYVAILEHEKREIGDLREEQRRMSAEVQEMLRKSGASFTPPGK